MTRILVAAGRQFDTAVLWHELDRPRAPRYEIFVLYEVGERRVDSGLLRTSRFWRARHTELDTVLDSLARRGVLCDGAAAVGNPVESIGRALDEFHPDEVVISDTPRLRRVNARVVRLLDDYARSTGSALKTSWLTSA